MHKVAARLGCKSAMVGTGWDNSGDIHIVTAKLGCKGAMVGTGWANFCPNCMDRLRNWGVHFWQGRLLVSEQVFDNCEC